MICRHGRDSETCAMCGPPLLTKGMEISYIPGVYKKPSRGHVQRSQSRKPLPTVSQPCIYLGDVQDYCRLGDHRRDIHYCLCEQTEWSRCWQLDHDHDDDDVGSCEKCPYNATMQPLPTVLTTTDCDVPRLVRRIDEQSLCPGSPGLRFNPSIIADGDGYVLAWRTGWKGSDIYVCRMDRNFQAVSEPVKLDLQHRECGYGREDPRLFRFRGRLHVAFSGVLGPRRILRTSVMYCRLGHDLRVEQLWFPELAGRNYWEKNWSFFEYADELYAVYAIAPHKILQVDGSRCEWAYETATPAPWKPGTEMRGGASPVLVGDEFYHFFHSRYPGKNPRYMTGLCTFDASPPFRVRRITREPIHLADKTTRPDGQWASVVFAGGAVRVDGRWIVAHGVHDRWSTLDAFDDLEYRFVPLHRPIPSMSGDVSLSFLFRSTPCPWRTARKIGRDAELAELSTTELRDYAQPWLSSVDGQAVLLHDGLPNDFAPNVTLTNVDVDRRLYPMDQRWRSSLHWLKSNPDVSRVWFADVNDCRFTTNPFAWLGDRPLAAQMDPVCFHDNEWFTTNVPVCPTHYVNHFMEWCAAAPLSCGAWGGTRCAVLGVLTELVAEIDDLRRWMRARPPTYPVNLDMLAFNYVTYQMSVDSFAVFRADREAYESKKADGPCIHDTELSRELVRFTR